MYSTAHIAIIILNWNGKDLLNKFLHSVIAHSKDAKIYMADNASTDNSVELVTKQFPTITILELEKNYGYAKGYNQAIEHIEEPILCLLNNDVEVTQNWLTPVIEVFNNNMDVAIAQPKILDFNNKSYFEYAGAAGGFIDLLGYPFCRGRIFNSIEADQGQYNDCEDIFWASGACFFVRNSVFKLLGGFDELYFAHMEEIDFCWRAFNKHLKCVYIGTSTVYHLGGGTLNNNSPAKTFLNFRNSLFSLVKNTDRFLLPRVVLRLKLDALAILRFLLLLKPMHSFAIVKAHFSFYYHLKYCLKQRRRSSQRAGYSKIKSIVWLYYLRKKQYFIQITVN